MVCCNRPFPYMNLLVMYGMEAPAVPFCQAFPGMVCCNRLLSKTDRSEYCHLAAFTPIITDKQMHNPEISGTAFMTATDAQIPASSNPCKAPSAGLQTVCVFSWIAVWQSPLRRAAETISSLNYGLSEMQAETCASLLLPSLDKK